MVAGECMVAGGMRVCQGVCVVARGYVWLLGGMRGCRGACIGYDKIRSKSGRYASYWKAFLLNTIHAWVILSNSSRVI